MINPLRPDFSEYHNRQRLRANSALTVALTPRTSPFAAIDGASLGNLFEAMQYSVNNGGKRLRPLLVYAGAEAIGGNVNPRLLDAAAVAIELMHCYSLIHDDLPAMDDDDLRRGQPTCHRAFDEATAILAGDALQTLAFQAILDAPANADTRVALLSSLASAAGPLGMVGGQALDLAAIGQNCTANHIQAMHQLKTGALLRAAVSLGGICAGASADGRRALDSYGNSIGLAFQIWDDVLDMTASTEQMGKAQGADADRNKPTYTSVLGLDKARAQVQSLRDAANAALTSLAGDTSRLSEAAEYMIARDH